MPPGIDYTSITMGDENIRKIAERMRRDDERDERLLATRRLAMQQEARRIAQAIGRADAEVKRVLLYGSLIAGRTITRQSDIDLLIDGGKLSRALSTAEESEYPVDVLRVEDLRTSIRAMVLESAEVLYESQNR